MSITRTCDRSACAFFSSTKPIEGRSGCLRVEVVSGTTRHVAALNPKAAISKACSEQADAKNLHGNERKKFRAECKRSGGEPS